jgi:putative ABC transport system substrate-binding protein
MRRRDFILAGLGWPLAARAQPSGTRRRIAFFHPAIPTNLMTETGGGSAWRAFFSELRRLGYVKGQNLNVDRYSAEGHHERYPDIVHEIVATRPELIVTGTEDSGRPPPGS